jgi:hypothetical protein
MVQVPPATNVTVDPDTVHTDVVCEPKLTVRPDVADAVTVNGAAPKVWLDNVPKVIV